MNAAALVAGGADIFWLVLDTLRFDVADRLLRDGRTPNFASLLPNGWEKRHTPATFTYPAHHAFFAGFLPTPVTAGRHWRLFACRFGGSGSVGPDTCVLDAADVPGGLAALGYRTVCVGGVGFFNPATPLGRTLPGLFAEGHWEVGTGVTDPRSFPRQIDWLEHQLPTPPDDRPRFVFVNVAAIHQPNWSYALPPERRTRPDEPSDPAWDTLETHAAALADVDLHLPRLLAAVRRDRPLLGVFCSDHGTCYGEDGVFGHRRPHRHVWEVPFAQFVLPPRDNGGRPL